MTTFGVSSRNEKTEVQMPIAEIRPDMVLSRDIVIDKGITLLAKNTMLNHTNCSRLQIYDIPYVYVKAASINTDLPYVTFERTPIDKKVHIAKRDDFKAFEKNYKEKTKEVEKAIRAISDGAVIDLSELQTLTSNIMGKLRCKSDVLTFISTLKNFSEHTYTHSTNVSLLSNLFGSWMGLNEESMLNLTTAGMLHDIGKTKTPPEILNKTGALTNAEYKIMKEHTVEGYRILEAQSIPADVKMAALLHHEKMDGSGYPLGLKGYKINQLAKMVSIVDIYDAMTANRVYRAKICPFTVIKTFERKSYGELDTEFLLVFLRNIAYTYIGAWVRLTDGREAEVMFINQNNLANPIVRTADGAIIDLVYEKDLSISELL